MGVVRQVADRLGIPNASVDWRQTLHTTKPDIVALATPAVLRREVIEAATDLGAHIYCDKPLAVDAEEARLCYELVQRAGVKHAYAATHRYDPTVAWLAELVADGVIGSLTEIEATVTFGPPELTPWGWMDSLAAGGGILNQGFPHSAGMLERVTGGRITRAMGYARCDRTRAPVVPDLHDFRQRWSDRPNAGEAAELEWRACDADGSAFFMGEIGFGDGSDRAIGVTYLVASRQVGIRPDEWILYGDEGTLRAKGLLSFEQIRHWTGSDQEPALLPAPQRLRDALPHLEGTDDDVYRKWAALALDFVADIRGEVHAPYLTFHDGWRYQVAIDAIRAGSGWTDLPS
jgi:predicted dehydrogenase